MGILKRGKVVDSREYDIFNVKIKKSYCIRVDIIKDITEQSGSESKYYASTYISVNHQLSPSELHQNKPFVLNDNGVWVGFKQFPVIESNDIHGAWEKVESFLNAENFTIC